MKNQKQINGQVVAYGTEDDDFPELETIDQEELYNFIAKFIRKAIPIKGEKLSIVNGLSNRVSPPQTPYILIQSSREGTLSCSQTRYINQHKIIHQVCEAIVSIEFYGSQTIKSH